MSLRIVLADDHAVVRAGLRALLSGERDLEIVGEAGDGEAALELVGRLRPDVLLVDLSMTGLNGVEVIAKARLLSPATQALVLSMHATPEFVRPALRAGAIGYVVKGGGVESLVEAVRSVAAGKPFIGAEARRARAPQPEPPSPVQKLTPREREVLQLVAEGHTNREIARVLGVAPKTVDVHRTNLMAKLDLHDAASLTRLALRSGLVSDP